MFAHEIPNWLNTPIRRQGWKHVDAFWYKNSDNRWCNQTGKVVSEFTYELFTADDWEAIEVVTVFDWVTSHVIARNSMRAVIPSGSHSSGDTRYAVIHECLAEANAPYDAYPILGSKRDITKSMYCETLLKKASLPV